jgi:carboxypeptidase C (cathepsin A)
MLKGGFIAGESYGKDSPQRLSNNILEYELILQQNGNFSTKPSNAEEAF